MINLTMAIRGLGSTILGTGLASILIFRHAGLPFDEQITGVLLIIAGAILILVAPKFGKK